MIGTWYRDHEINQRSGIFTAADIAATMLSGYIQAGIYEAMEGHLGGGGQRRASMFMKRLEADDRQRLGDSLLFVSLLIRLWLNRPMLLRPTRLP